MKIGCSALNARSSLIVRPIYISVYSVRIFDYHRPIHRTIYWVVFSSKNDSTLVIVFNTKADRFNLNPVIAQKEPANTLLETEGS